MKVEAPDLCPRYMAHYVRNIRMSESPRWMKRHLALCGLRSISNVVDITNHTLLEMGQPMHAFDLNKVAGRSITVRRAVEGEKITTLDEKEFTLNPNNLVICDAEKPVALAGIMGGANSGMDDAPPACSSSARPSPATRSARPAALWARTATPPPATRRVWTALPELGLARALHLIQELDCGDITTLEYDLTDGRPLERKHIVTTPAKICGVLGITVPDQTMIDILKRLEFTVDVQADGSWDVSAPLYREDVESFPDLAEEVIREYGYDHIVPTFLNTAAVTNGGLNYEQKQQLKTKRLLAAQGFYEASTLAFYSNAEFDMLHIPAEDEARKAIRILNPISENLSVMRTLLAPSMLNVIVDNLKKGNAEGRLFEMAPVYLAKELPINEHPHERQTLCIGAFGPEEDFFTVKGALEGLAEGFDLTFTYQRETTSWLHPGISAAVYCNGKRLGVFGKLANEINAELEIAKEQKDSQNIYLGELDYEALMSCVEGELRYKPLSPYAAVKRDLALVCDEAVACGDIEETIRKASPLITEVKLFDIYRGANLGEGKKSMAFSLTLSDPAAEVSNEQVERTVKKVLGNLKFKLGIEIR
ncbi:MAG: phenylalanine--tRNA ligase subunit beta [Faecalibacterium prausnitzii]